LGDVIEVVELRGTCPAIRFLGRGSSLSDHFGEKLNALHVRSVFDGLFARFGLEPEFFLLTCECFDGHHAYTLFIEDRHAPDEELRIVGRELDRALEENFHYRYCRELGQLGPVRVFRVVAHGRESYLEACAKKGQKLGDVKPLCLHGASGWIKAFQGNLLESASRDGSVLC
jgi:hypothetical protein